MSELTLHKAVYSDEKLLYEWRKNDESDAWWQGDSVTPEDHKSWLLSRLLSPLVYLWIAEVDGVPVGQVRVDSGGEISFSVARDHRGKGYGAEMIRRAVSLAGPRFGRLKASVDRTNEGGISTLAAAGFKVRPDVVFMRWPR